MVTFFLLIIENPIIKRGFESIIKENVVPSVVIKSVNKKELLNYIKFNKVHFVIIEVFKNKKNKKFIQSLFELDSKINIIIYTRVNVCDLSLFFGFNNTSYVSLSSSVNEIVSAIYGVYNKNRLSLEIKSQINFYTPIFKKKLSAREYEVLECLIEGESSTSIAKKIGCAICTISTYKKRVFEKLNVKSVGQILEKIEFEYHSE